MLGICLFLCVLPGAIQLPWPDGSAGSGEAAVNISSLNFTIECDSHVTNHSCKGATLERIAKDVMAETAQIESGLQVEINVLIPVLTIVKRVNFSGIDSLSIKGNRSIVECTAKRAGVVFSDVSNLVLNNITVTNCGAEVHTAFTEFSSAISIIRCGNMDINHMLIIRNRGVGMIIIDHHGGTINIKSSNFTENTLPVGDPSYLNLQGGGGVFIGDFEQDPPTPISIHFTSCLFEKNVPFTRRYNFLYTNDLGEAAGGSGRGGGLYIALERSLTDVQIFITNSTFAKNQGFIGGGLSVEIEGAVSDYTEDVTVTLEDCTFEENGCSEISSTGIGGGAHLTFNTFNRPNLNSSKYILTNVRFIDNCADLGGGVYFFSNHEQAPLTMQQTLLFDKCTFRHNHAHTGSAIDITPNIFDRFSSGFLVVPVFRDCIFTDNTVVVNSQNLQTTRGIGTVYTSLYNIKFDGYNQFINNFGTALNVINGIADFSNSSARFINNIGAQGGAVALIGLSTMKLGLNLNYSFINNVAQDRGGAIYAQFIDNHDFTISRSCFMQYADGEDSLRYIPFVEFNANITFKGNRAEAGIGHAIYATSFHPCQVVSNNTGVRRTYTLINITDVFAIRGVELDENPKYQPQTATDGAELSSTLYTRCPLTIIPGEEHEHQLRIFDDVGNLVNESLRATVSNNDVSVFSTCLGRFVTLNGASGQRANLSLQTHPPRQSYIELEVELAECPPGFISSDGVECTCNSHSYIGLIKCDTNILHSYLMRGFWIGRVNSDSNELATGLCPVDYCNYDNQISENEPTVRLPQRVDQLDRAICGEARTGVLCGKCRDGFTTYFHSPHYQCKSQNTVLCKVGWLFYILSEIVPVTIVFITVLALNISFTSGAINGFILFSQLVYSLKIDESSLLTFPTGIQVMSYIYEIIYGFFNMDFFNVDALSYCLWPNATALDMIAIKYITIIYVLFLIFGVIWVANRCGGKCFGKWCRITTLKSSVIHGMTAFLIICYAQNLKVSLTLLSQYNYNLQRGSTLEVRRIVYLNGNLFYFRGWHLLYAIPALFFLLTIGVLPPILLLAYPFFNKVLALCGWEESKGIKVISRKLRIISLKPLLDSFQGSFKDNLRFFAGLYFLYRWIGLFLAATYSNYGLFYTVVEISLIIILALHAICQPYIEWIHNVIDTLLFADLAIINALSFANYYISQSSGDLSIIRAIASIQLVLIYLPIVTVAIVGVLMLHSKCTNCERGQSQNGESNADISGQNIFKLTPLVRHINSTSVSNTLEEEELPYRLIASDVDNNHFETSNIESNERDSSTAVTY